MDDAFYEELSKLVNEAFNTHFRQPGADSKSKKPKLKPIRTKPKKETDMQPQPETQNTEPQVTHSLSENADKIFGFLSEWGTLAGKSFILENTKIPPHKWQPAITELKDFGFVVQVGNKKGAKYRTA
jgi:hypothetical protein